MPYPVCSCCARPSPVAAQVRSRPLRLANGWIADPGRAERSESLCGPCFAWLSALLQEVRRGDAPAGLIGKPTAAGRILVFEDQCAFCRSMPGETGNLLESVAVAAGQTRWQPMFACPSCDLWVAGLAADGRSARGQEGRAIDGPYGHWPHPNLRELSVALAVADDGARAAILQALKTMSITVARRPEPETVLLLEVRTGVGEVIREPTGWSEAQRILLAPLTERATLGAMLANGALAWLTIPVTPQQVTAALTAAVRQRGLRIRWDPETALPTADLTDFQREALRCVPAGGTDRSELAWLLKRFSRGYDEVVISGGELLLLPRANAETLDSVGTRLERLLAGRCRFERVDPTIRARRFDVAG